MTLTGADQSHSANRTLRGVYGITDDQLLAGDSMLSKIEDALQSGLCLLQYRSKQTGSRLKKATASELLELCQMYSTPLIINDDVALCGAIGADGVHLGRNDASLETARAELGASAIIGVTCHSDIDLALKAEQGSASYVAFGRFFPSQTKPSAPAAAISILGQAKQRLQIPVVAIGGINAENGAQLIDAGADMLAVVNSLFGDGDVGVNAKQLLDLFQ